MGGVLMAMSIAVMAAGWAGRPSSRLRYREVAHLTLRALYRGRRAGSRVASTARPIAPVRSAGPVRADPLGGGELVLGGLDRGGEAGPVRVGARAGLDGGDHGHAQQLVEAEQGPGLLGGA
jgi:hypothetical protein